MMKIMNIYKLENKFYQKIKLINYLIYQDLLINHKWKIKIKLFSINLKCKIKKIIKNHKFVLKLMKQKKYLNHKVFLLFFKQINKLVNYNKFLACWIE